MNFGGLQSTGDAVRGKHSAADCGNKSKQIKNGRSWLSCVKSM